jgi:hypothetical protein
MQSSPRLKLNCKVTIAIEIEHPGSTSDTRLFGDGVLLSDRPLDPGDHVCSANMKKMLGWIMAEFAVLELDQNKEWSLHVQIAMEAYREWSCNGTEPIFTRDELETTLGSKALLLADMESRSHPETHE